MIKLGTEELIAGFAGGLSINQIYAGNVKLWPVKPKIWDDFERTTLGTNWITASGYSTPLITGGQLYSNSGDRKAYWYQQYDGGDDMQVSAVIGVASSGANLSLHLGLNPTMDAADFRSYVYLDITPNGYSSGWRDYAYHTDLKTGVWSLKAGDTVTLQRKGNVVQIGLNGALVGSWSGQQPTTGVGFRYVGVTVKSGGSRIDEFYADKPTELYSPFRQIILDRTTSGTYNIPSFTPDQRTKSFYWVCLGAGGSGGNGNSGNANSGSGGYAGTWSSGQMSIDEYNASQKTFTARIGSGGSVANGSSANGISGGSTYFYVNNTVVTTGGAGAGGQGSRGGSLGTAGRAPGSWSSNTFGDTYYGGAGGTYADNSNGTNGGIGAGGGGGAGYIFGTYWKGGAGGNGRVIFVATDVSL